MPSVNDLKQSKFLTRHDVGRGMLVTIRGYEQINVAKEGAGEELKYCLNFNETEKPLVLNSTNGQIIASITKSDDFDNWIGHKVVLYDEPNISFGGKLVGGIRVRAPRIPAAATAPAAPAPASAPKPMHSAPPPNPALVESPDPDDVPF